MIKKIFGVFFIMLISCSIMQHPWAYINTLPMYGSVEKPAELISADNLFIREQTKQYGSSDSASFVYNYLAWQYIHVGDLETAIRRFNQSWLLDSTFAGTYFGFSAWAELQGDSQNKYDFKLGEEKDKAYEEQKFYLLNMGILYRNTNEYDLAIQKYKSIIALEKDNIVALEQIGQIYGLKDDWNNAESYLLKAVKNGADNNVTYDWLGYAYQNLGDESLALSYYQKSIEKDSTYLYPLYRSSLLYQKMGKLDEALSYINKCIKLEPTNKEFIKTKKEINKLRENSNN